MADLSRYTDDELRKIAGIDTGNTAVAAAPDLSSYSDEDLMKIAGVQTPGQSTLLNKPSYIQSYKPNLGEKIFRGANKAFGFNASQKAKDQNVISLANTISQEKNIPMPEAIKYVNDNYDNLVAERFGQYTATKQLNEGVGGAMKGMIAGGIVAAPVPTLLGLAGFEALNKLIPTEKIIKNKFPNMPSEIKNMVMLGDLAAKGKLAHATYGKALTKLPKPLTRSTPEYIRQATTKSPEKMTAEATKIMREVLQPRKGSMQDIEVKKHKNINDLYKLAAEENLPIDKTIDNKKMIKDTTRAQKIIQQRATDSQKTVDDFYNSNTAEKFSLQKLRDEAITRIDNNKTMAEATKILLREDIKTLIEPEIEVKGDIIDSRGYNQLKQSMGKIKFNPSRSSQKEAAGILADTAKNNLENTFKDVADIKNLNKKTSDYLDLLTLLKRSHGDVVSGGHLGKMFAQVTGAGIGATTLGGIPYAGPIAGAMLGRTAGAKLYEKFNNPLRQSAKAGKLAQRALHNDY